MRLTRLDKFNWFVTWVMSLGGWFLLWSYVFDESHFRQETKHHVEPNENYASDPPRGGNNSGSDDATDLAQVLVENLNFDSCDKVARFSFVNSASRRYVFVRDFCDPAFSNIQRLQPPFGSIGDHLINSRAHSDPPKPRHRPKRQNDPIYRPKKIRVI